MKYVVMIQARCGSSRLPNKVLMDLCGKTALQRMIERVKRSKKIDEVMVVTSIEKENLPIVSLCASLGVRVFIGSEQDVLDRYYQAARLFKPEYVIRLTADCPCFDPGLLDDAISKMDHDTEYCAMMSEMFADGLDLEIVSYSALKKAWKNATLKSEREHVTQYIIHHPEEFKQQDYKSEIDNFGDKRWTIDEKEDYILVKKIFEYFLNIKKEDFNYLDILKLLKEQPELEKINCMYARNEGLAKLIKEDCVIEIND